jgi:hypothetical protein
LKPTPTTTAEIILYDTCHPKSPLSASYVLNEYNLLTSLRWVGIVHAKTGWVAYRTLDTVTVFQTRMKSMAI